MCLPDRAVTEQTAEKVVSQSSIDQAKEFLASEQYVGELEYYGIPLEHFDADELRKIARHIYSKLEQEREHHQFTCDLLKRKSSMS